MIFEYAISPSLFNSEDRIALFASAIGVDHGRLIADYPKGKWEQYALAIAKHCAQGDVQLQAWKECLIGLRKRNAYTQRQAPLWSDDSSWIQNAIAEHQRLPFRGIIDGVTRPECESVLPFGVPMVTSPLWEANGSVHVTRKANAMITQMAPLLNLSKQIILIDRNFQIDGRFTNVLNRLLTFVRNEKIGPAVTQIKYVVSDAVYRPDEMKQRFQDFISPITPQGLTVKFYIQPKRELHDRFVLTDKGGLQYGQGLDEGEGEVLVQRLGFDAWQAEMNNFDANTIDSFEVKPATSN